MSELFAQAEPVGNPGTVLTTETPEKPEPPPSGWATTAVAGVSLTVAIATAAYVKRRK